MRNTASFAAVGVLAALGALDGPERAFRKALEDKRDTLRLAAEEHQAAALPNANADWRSTLPMVKAEVAAEGGANPQFSRQERRALERNIARAEASTQKIAARREAGLNKKSRRAQRAVQAQAVKAT